MVKIIRPVQTIPKGRVHCLTHKINFIALWNLTRHLNKSQQKQKIQAVTPYRTRKSYRDMLFNAETRAEEILTRRGRNTHIHHRNGPHILQR